MIELIESDLKFCFPNDDVMKFDEEEFYRNYFNNLPGAKGVDFMWVSAEQDFCYMIEVKNCRGHEAENRWRIVPGDKKVNTAALKPSKDTRHSLDIEVAEKVAMSLACVMGAVTHGEKSGQKGYIELIDYIRKTEYPQIRVVLILEGEFASHSRSKKMIMDRLRLGIERELKWLKCKIFVEDVDTNMDKKYEVVRM